MSIFTAPPRIGQLHVLERERDRERGREGEREGKRERWGGDKERGLCKLTVCH